MAKPQGLFRFKGSLGFVTGVDSREGFHYRTKQEIPRERYERAPEYEAFRENGKLMGEAARLSKALRGEIAPLLVLASDARMYARLNAAMRRVLLTPGQSAAPLEGFEFDGKHMVAPSINRMQRFKVVDGAVAMPQFHPKLELRWPVKKDKVQIGFYRVACDFEAREFAVEQAGLLTVCKNDEPMDVRWEVNENDGAPSCIYLLRVVFSDDGRFEKDVGGMCVVG